MLGNGVTKSRLTRVAGVMALCCAAIISYLALVPWPDTPDGLFHLQRVRALADAVRWGVFYPRWFGDFSFGYGYPVLNFYAPAFYYPPALLHLTGLDLITSVQIVAALIYAASGLAAYALLRRWTRPVPAVLGALLYLVYPYHLYDLSVRGALPEYMAFLWLPVLALTMVRWMDDGYDALVVGEGSASLIEGSVTFWRGLFRRPLALVLASLSWTALILTHNLTALMALVVALCVSIPLALARAVRSRGDRWRACRWLAMFGLPILLGAMLSAPYALPALAESGWVGIGAAPGTRGYAGHLASLVDLFTWSPVYPYPSAAQPNVPTPGYVLPIVVLAVILIFLPRARGKRKPLILGGAVAALSLWLTTAQSAFLWDLLAPILGKLQFPWRWQAVLALALVLLLSLIIDLIAGTKNGSSRWLFISLGLIMGGYLTVYGLASLHPRPASYVAADLTPEQMWAFDAAHGQVGASWAGEFLPRWVTTEQRWAIARDPTAEELPDDAVASVEALPPGTSLEMISAGYLGKTLSYSAPAPTTLIFHTFYYPAWRVEIDGRPAVTKPVSDLGLLAAELPAGSHVMERRWAATSAVWAGRVAAGLGWLVLLVLLVWGGNPSAGMSRTRRWAIALWLLVGMMAVGGASGVLERSQLIQPVEVAYDSVSLQGIRVSEAHPGGVVPVELDWLVRDKSGPLTAFVHVIAPDGHVVAQHDGPLGGQYTPSSRWLPGLLLPDRHLIPLPADLPPGEYALKVGLYPPGEPKAPLIPAGGNPADPRCDVGTLEVLP